MKLIDDPEKRRDMGMAGRELVAELSDHRKQVDRVEALYVERIKEKTRRYCSASPQAPKKT